ncbi:FxLYD domain-containing protein [Streptomyces sp. MS06]|uniref:FxLYD domain-containing protein n=1 Tax=Streptomyces sp. MS06 TaxID=3385974 RepID=UPI00399F533E
MSGRVTARSATAAALVAVIAVGASACSGDDGGSASSARSKAASAASSVGAEVTAAASSLASRAASALASATAEAGRRLESLKGGIDAKGDVRLGEPRTDSDGRTTVTVTARNTTQDQQSFLVQVNFRDDSGNRLDTVVVTVSDVAAGESGTATARSTHKLSGTVKAEVGTALRY